MATFGEGHTLLGGMPYHLVRKLILHLENITNGRGTCWALDALRSMVGVESLELVSGYAQALKLWHRRGEHHSICPSLHQLTVCGFPI
jgi:hypothetical protein